MIGALVSLVAGFALGFLVSKLAVRRGWTVWQSLGITLALWLGAHLVPLAFVP